jgi:5,10-methylenetetrahydromethanopterin reductase
MMAKRAVGEMVPGFWALGQKQSSAKEALLAGTGISDQEFAESAARIKSGESAVDVLDERYIEAFSLFGTPEDCLHRAAAFGAAGVTELALTFDGPTAFDDMKLLSHVLPDRSI